MTHVFDSIPELAGLATYDRAASVGWSVDENVRRLLRLQWAERRLMSVMIAHLASEPVWEAKCALALHQWYAAQHVESLRIRISEMRSPVPPLDRVPDGAEALDAFFDELLRSRGTVELLTGIYRVALPAVADAYAEHHEGAHPLVDHPTRRIVDFAMYDVEDAIEWGERAVSALTRGDKARAEGDAWASHLAAYLAEAGGVAGNPPHSPAPRTRPPSRATTPFVPDFRPARDERFTGQYNFEFPPHVVYNMPGVPADERNLALLCKRTLEMDVPEMMASFITERADQPWEFYRDYSRQLWDEARHAMMGTVALDARGVDWMAEIPLNVSFALRLNLHATPIERQVMLFAIEQSLMPGETGKRFEHETAVEAGDELSAHFHDYDWADEVLHAQIGRRALKRDGITPDEARELAKAVHEKTWAALAQYAHLGEQRDWWPEFVRHVLGEESEAGGARPELNVFSE